MPFSTRPALPPNDPAAPGQADPLPSAALLRGRDSILIDHQGTRYVLRATRAGKLILTK